MCVVPGKNLRSKNLSRFGNTFGCFKVVPSINRLGLVPPFLARVSFVAPVLTRRSRGTSVPLARVFGPSTLRYADFRSDPQWPG